jgi:hypothetical protein
MEKLQRIRGFWGMIRPMTFLLPFPLLILAAHQLVAQPSRQVVINEFLASNVSTNAEIVDFDDFSDWIELFNTGETDVDISGYGLTDSPGNPGKWKFPPGTILPAKGFLLLWADGFDETPGKTHQRPYSPNDPFVTRYFHLNFKLDAAGEFIGLADAAGGLVDSVVFGMQRNDVSMGRKPDGSSTWCYFGDPTPADSNTTGGVTTVEYSGTPAVSPRGGFLTGNSQITVDAQPAGSQIRYTIDGSRPTSRSLLYTNPVVITQTTVFRARVYEPGKLPGPIVTQTYWIDENISLPVISVSTHPDLLWDRVIGIYDNMYREREIPVHFELFEAGGEPGFTLDAGLMLTGQLSLYYPQKSFTINAATRFGTDAITYQVFPQRKLNSFTSLYLRNAGVPDNRSSFFRDALLHSLVINRMDLDCQGYRPAVVFLDGRYWGIYNMRDKINSSYLGSLHKLNPEDIDLLEYVTTPEPDVMEGQSDDYHAFYDFVANSDLSQSVNYGRLAAWMDIDEYLNYQITEIYCDNVIWGDQNVRMWRERKQGARWRWILFDTDYGFGMPNQISNGYTHNALRYATSSNSGDLYVLPPWSTLLFRKLLLNQEFKTKFIQRFASYLNSVFHPDSVVSLVNQIQGNLSPEMSRHINRWKYGDFYYGYPIPDYATWAANVSVVRAFARNRPFYQRQHMLEYFGLTGIAEIHFNIAASGSGQIRVNGIEKIVGSFDGSYFKGVPTTLEAVPAIGYRFVRWEGLDSARTNPAEIVPTHDSLSVTAVFEPVNISIIPVEVSVDTTLNAAHSPYYALGGVTVDSGATLRISEGVHILMPEGGSLVIHGRLLVEGTQLNPVVIEPNEHSRSWGALCFVNAADSSAVTSLSIVGATKGPDFTRDWAAISGHKSRFSLKDVSVENSGMPVFAQFGSLTISGCRLRSPMSGDLINIKRADYALTENNDLRGNEEFDSDGIDYDGVVSGAIRGNRIYGIYGFNSDAIDLGEDAKNILVENNLIYNIADKGVSVGQASTTLIRRNVIANCGMGVGVKDFDSYARIEQNTFYANTIGIACYEKILGHGGANADVVNCIVANSVTSAILVDKLSGLGVSYSLSNTDTLPGLHNLKTDPILLNNLYLSPASPAVNNGSPLLPSDPDGSLPDIGAYPYDSRKQNTLIIDEIHYRPVEGGEYQFIELYNPGPMALNVNGCRLAGCIEYQFGAEAIASGEYIVVAKNAAVYQGKGYRVFQWDRGSLSEQMGALQLYDRDGQLVDFVDYHSRMFWPSQPDGLGPSLELHSTFLENMASSSWRGSYVKGGTPGRPSSSASLTGLYVNEILAQNDSVLADENGEYDDWIEVYNATSLPIDVGGLYMTDNLARPSKHLIPRSDPQQTTIPAGGYLIFWADGQPEQGIRHLNFKLDRAGEQVGLVQPLETGYGFIDSLTFPAQSPNRSYGRFPDGSSTWHFFNHPTPQAGNQSPNGIDEDPHMAFVYSLSQNYPNPFNPSTGIRYQLAGTSDVRLVVYDLLGREVALLIDEKQAAGNYRVNWNAAHFSSGVYFYRLTAGTFRETRRMLLIK